MVIAARCLPGILIAGAVLVLTAPARAEEASGRPGPVRLAMLDDVAFGRLSVSDAMPQSPKRLDLAALKQALESYRRERGAYLESKSQAALVDSLNPRYLARIIRIDPWHKPYEYEGSRTGFVLRSSGPDEKTNTADDVTVTR